MIIKMDTGPGYQAVWNLMHEMFIPCRNDVEKVGRTYEEAKERFYHFASNNHDDQDTVSAEIYTVLMNAMDEARKELRPHVDEWWRARHGYGLN